MRLKYSKLITFLIVAVNIFLVFYTWKLFMTTSNAFGNLSASAPLIVTQSSSSIIIAAKNTINSGDSLAIHQHHTQKPIKPKDKIQTANKHIKKAITIIFRDFYHFDNDLKGSIDGILALIPAVQIFIIYNNEPYPPLDYLANYTNNNKNNVKFINLGFDIRKTAKMLSPIYQIKTKYVLLLPDSVRLGGRSIIQKMIKELSSGDGVEQINAEHSKGNNNKEEIKRGGANGSSVTVKGQKKMLVIPFASNVRTLTNCCQLKLDMANWTLEYSVINGTNNCDLFLQKHAILIETAVLKEMPDALSMPYPEMFYIQAKVGKIKKLVLPSLLQDGKRLFTAFHNKQRKKEIRRQQFKDMYRRLQIKKVIRHVVGKPNTKNEKLGKRHRQNGGLAGAGGGGGNNGVAGPGRSINNNDINQLNGGKNDINGQNVVTLANTSMQLITSIEYYGCEKNTKSCVGTVYNMKPFYVYLEKHTPPCCVEKLKAVFNHVLDEFENVGIRYWLDNQALQNAIEMTTLSPDAYEIDISFNAFDLERSSFLKKSQSRPLADASGFYWIKATDGHYFRVQYSKINQIGVNLLPFDIEADRVIPSGFYGWKAKEFSTEFLHPMSTVMFLGKNVMCPNNVKEFLEMKKH